MLNNSKLKNSDVYISSAWQQHAELITHLCHFSQNILLVLGQAGSGKSTFFEHFLSAPGAGLKVCGLKANLDQTVEEILKEVATGFELNWENAASTTLEVKTQAIEAYQRAHETWMLMIDDAHLLDDMQLAALLQLVQFNDEARQQLHLVLLGEPSLEGRLFAPTLASYAEGKVYSIELEPWTLHDAKRYFARKMATSHFSPEQIAAIFERTKGLPGKIVQEQQLLQNPFTDEANTMTKQQAKRWTHPIALGAVAGFLLGGSYLLLNSTQDEEMVSAPVNAAQVENNRLDNSDEKMAMEEEPAPVVLEQVATTLKPTAETTVIQQAENTQATASNKAQVNESHAPITVRENSTTVSTSTTAPASTTTAATSDAQVTTATATVTATTITTEATPASTHALTEAPKAAVKTQEQSKKLSKEEEYLLSIDKQYYTLQLVGARNEKSIQQFIQKHQLEEHAYSYHTKLSGKDWYVVVLGEYATMDEAKAAAADLPSHIAAKPWIREFNSIHSDIKKQG